MLFFHLQFFLFFIKLTYINTVIYKYITNLSGIYLLKTKQHRYQSKLRNTPKVNNKDTYTKLNPHTNISTANSGREIVGWEQIKNN